MDPTFLIFLSSGLFLGWSLGTNDAANVFGTAVASRMVRFGTAAGICAVFVILGAVLEGEGAARGLSRLGSVDAIAGSFTVALAAALTVYGMTKVGLPVSTTQAVVGAIVGWNLFSGSLTDMRALSQIIGTWIACPILGAIVAAVLYRITVRVVRWSRLHLFWLDMWTRLGLIVAGAIGSYSLGANNIANVMGVFVPATPFGRVELFGFFTLTPAQRLFLIGSIAIAIGVFYSRRVMETVGSSILPVSSIGAWVAVIAHSTVLFLFSSKPLQGLLESAGLPSFPLVPVSSSQAIVGAVIGIGLAHGMRGARQVRWGILLHIGSGWVSTPIIAAVICYVALFFMQNVFQQQVHRPAHYMLSEQSLDRVAGELPAEAVRSLVSLEGEEVQSAVQMKRAVAKRVDLPRPLLDRLLKASRLERTILRPERMERLDPAILTPAQIEYLRGRPGQGFTYRWQLAESLAHDQAWQDASDKQLDHVIDVFRR